MEEQLRLPEEIEPNSGTCPNANERKRIDHVAQEVAQGASRTEQNYDKDHGIFSK
jgi:hypothetical protein